MLIREHEDRLLAFLPMTGMVIDIDQWHKRAPILNEIAAVRMLNVLDINFLKAREIGLEIPFSFFESASFVYDYDGRIVRNNGKAVVPMN